MISKESSGIDKKKSRVVYPVIKRCMDILGSIIGLTIFSPVFLVIIIAIYINDNKSSPFFVQKRIGKNGLVFNIYKFRTMITNAEAILNSSPELYKTFKANGYKFPEGKDPRVTKLGLFLRKTSLDEIPQFLNVLNGSMSLVGPRPIIEKELQEYATQKNKFLSVKPGITGWWQVSGRSEIGYPERCDLELEYVDRASLILDLKILCLTFVSVLKRRGAI